MNKLMRSITRGSNDYRLGTPSSIMKAKQKIESRDSKEFSENVPEDNQGSSMVERINAFQKSITNNQPLRRGQTLYSNIDPFLSDMDEYDNEYDEDFGSLFSDEEDFKKFQQLKSATAL